MRKRQKYFKTRLCGSVQYDTKVVEKHEMVSVSIFMLIQGRSTMELEITKNVDLRLCSRAMKTPWGLLKEILHLAPGGKKMQFPMSFLWIPLLSY